MDTIDYIVYSTDFPTTIAIPKDRKNFLENMKQEKGPQAVSQAKKFYAAGASITSLTFFADQHLKSDPSYMLLDANKYYRRKLNPSLIENRVLKFPFVGDLQIQFESAINFIKRGDEARGIEILAELGVSNPEQVAVFYWQARAYAQGKQIPQAVECLELCKRKGWGVSRIYSAGFLFQDGPQATELANVGRSAAQSRILPYHRFSTSGFLVGQWISQSDRLTRCEVFLVQHVKRDFRKRLHRSTGDQ